MKPLLRKSFMAGVLLLLFVGACTFLYSERALDGLVRPWIERQAGQALGGQVSIGKLSLQTGLLKIDALNVETTEGLSISVPRIDVEFSFASLLQRRLEAVRIDSPRLKLRIPQQGDAATSAQALPSRPSLSIDQLMLGGGEVLVRFGERQVLLHDIALQGALGELMPFKVATFVGEGQDNPLLIRGQARWAEALDLSVQEVLWQKRSLLEAPIDLELLAGGEARGGGALQLQTFDDEMLEQLFAVFGMESPLPAGFGFELNAPAVSVSIVKEGLKVGLTVDGGRLRQETSIFPFEKLQLELRGQGEVWQVQGHLLGPAATAISFAADYNTGQASGTAAVEAPDPDHLMQELFGGELPGIAGSLQADADFSWRSGNLEAKVRLNGLDRKPLANDYRFNLAPVSGELTWQQRTQREHFDLILQLNKSPLLNASGELHRVKFALVDLNRQQLMTVLNPGLLPDAVDAIEGVTAAGQLLRNVKGGWSGELQMAARRLGASGVDVNDLRLQGRLDLADGEVSFSHGTLAAGLIKGSELNGRLSGRFVASLTGQKYFVKLEKFALEKAEYLAVDGLSGLGSGEVNLSGRITGQIGGAGPELILAGTIKASEVLAGAFYADLSNLSGSFTLAGELTTDSTNFRVRELKVEVPGFGALGGSGLLTPDEITLTGSMSLPDLAASYGNQLGPVLAEMLPALEGLSLEGALAINYELLWSPSRSLLAGEVGLKGLDAAWPKLQFEMIDGNGHLPFVLNLGDSPPDETRKIERYGEISFVALSVGPASLEEGRLQFAAAPNRFTFRSPLLFRLAGGRVAIRALTFGLGNAGPQGSVHIAVQDVDLELLTRELELPIMRGGISADLGEIRYADQKLSSEGVAEIDVFAGRFQIRNIRYLEPFSPYPVFTADVDFSGLDLYQATNTFDFGEMNGVVDGYVHGLRLFGATPSAFEARLESQPSGKRNISVKALNNLSILSQGGIQAALSRGVYRFIDFYRYRKIGIFCTLDSDNFVLMGTAVDGTNKTLVDGGLIPPRIDIVTSASIISFKEMVRRVSRIKRARN